VRPGEVIEIERRKARGRGINADMLPADKEKDGPEDIGEARRDDENRERRARGSALRGEGDSKCPMNIGDL